MENVCYLKVSAVRREDIGVSGAPIIYIDLPSTCDIEECRELMADVLAERGYIPKDWNETDEYADMVEDMDLAIYEVLKGNVPVPFGYRGDDLEEFLETFDAVYRMGEYDSRCLMALYEYHYSGEQLDTGEMSELIAMVDNTTFYDDMDASDVAEQLVEDGCYGEIPESIACYIDYDKIGRDMIFSGEWAETSYGVISLY